MYSQSIFGGLEKERNMKNIFVEVFSTFATDIYITEKGLTLKNQLGGPALFIQKTLDSMGIDYALNSTSTAIVEIKLTSYGEFGRIVLAPKVKRVVPLRKSSILLISTLLDEWMLPKKSARVFLDVQGYVRNGSHFGGKQLFSINPNIESMLECIKANEVEIKYLSPDFLRKQKMKMLVITRGNKGVELFSGGKQYVFPATYVTGLTDSVGAGDTWFSAFVAYQAQGFNFYKAANMANIMVTKFLKTKKGLYENI